MGQKQSAPRGRPPKFDRPAVVQAAIGAFFRKGYEATTLADLETATGLDRSSLYNSFGGKRGLYETATRAYLDAAEDGLLAPLLAGSGDGYADLLEFLERLGGGLTSENAIPGCLIVNDMAAGVDLEAAERYRRLLETGLRGALERTGDLDQARREHRASFLAISVLGVNLVSKATDGQHDEIRRHIEAIIDTVKRWRAEDSVTA